MGGTLNINGIPGFLICYADTMPSLHFSDEPILSSEAIMFNMEQVAKIVAIIIFFIIVKLLLC